MSHVPPRPDADREAQRQAIIKRLCELQSLVANHVHEYRYAADCFCRQGWHPEPVSMNWRNDEHALEFIERAVIESVARINEVAESEVEWNLRIIRKGEQG